MPGTMLCSRAGEPDGMDVLHDVERVLGLPEDDALALALWLAVRRVFLWASVPDAARAGLLGAGTAPGCLAAAREQAPELADGALDTFAALWARPEAVEPEQVANACDQVGRWAAELGLMRTAVMFMEAAAAVAPENALRAMDAGLMCQRLGGPELMPRAEQWFQRAFGLARVAERSRKLLSIRALLAYGNWARDVGNYVLARRCYERAARRARRYKRWTYYATAQHNLLVLLFATGGDLSQGQEHAQAALDYYPRTDARIPHLAHDYAGFLTRHRLYSPAVRILKWLLPILSESRDQLLLSGSLAWAAAGAGEAETFEQATDKVLSLVRQGSLTRRDL